MNTEILFSSKKQDWEPPQYLYEQLDSQYHFDLDAAASHSNAKTPKYFTEEDDALQQDWGLYNSIFCNPPYSTKMQNEFVKKAFETYKKHNNTIVLLIPARTGTCDGTNTFLEKQELIF